MQVTSLLDQWNYDIIFIPQWECATRVYLFIIKNGIWQFYACTAIETINLTWLDLRTRLYSTFRSTQAFKLCKISTAELLDSLSGILSFNSVTLPGHFYSYVTNVQKFGLGV